MNQIGNYDIMILTETKILDALYYKNQLGYNVTCLRALPTTA